MQKKKGVGGERVQIACKNAYVINGRPPIKSERVGVLPHMGVLPHILHQCACRPGD